MSTSGSASYHKLSWCLLQNGVKDLAVSGHAALSFALLVCHGEQGIAQQHWIKLLPEENENSRMKKKEKKIKAKVKETQIQIEPSF